MYPSLFRYLTERWGDTLTPLYLTSENLRDLDRTTYTTTREVAHRGIIAVQAPFDELFNTNKPEQRAIMGQSSLFYLFARHSGVIPSNIPPNVTVIPLQPDGPWDEEWFVVAYTPELTFLLCAHSVMRVAPKMSPSHYALVRTVNPTIVQAALTYLQDSVMKLGVPIPRPPLPIHSLHLQRIETFYQRITATLTNPQGAYPQIGLVAADYYYTAEVTEHGQVTILQTYGRLTDTLGYEEKEFLQDKWLEILHPDDQQKAIEHFERLVRGHDDTCEMHILTRNREDMWLMDYAVPEWSETLGRVVRIHGAVRNVTKTKKAEAQLRASEQRFMLLFQHAPVMAVTTEYKPEGIYITAINETFLNRLGYTKSEVIGQPLKNFYTPESQKLIDEWYEKNRNAGSEFLLAERDLVTRDGKIIPTLLHATGLSVHGHTPQGTYALFVDITERKRFESELKKMNVELEHRVTERTASLEIANRILNLKVDELETAQTRIREGQERLEEFYATTTDLVQITDNEGSILYVNHVWQEKLGYEVEDLQHLKAQDLFLPEDLKALSDNIDIGLKQNKQVFDLNSRIQTKDGRILHCEGTVIFRIMEQGRYESQAVFRDVTARHRAEQLLREESDRYRLVVRSLPNTVLMLYDRDLCYQLVEGNTLNLVGLSREYLEGKTLYEALRPQEIKELEPYYQRVFEGEKVDFSINYRSRFFNVQIQPLFDEENNVALGMIIAEDVTDKRAAEKERTESEARYRLVAESIPDSAVYLFDTEMRYLLAVGPAMQYRSQSDLSIEGKTIWEVMPPEHAQRVAPLYEAALRGEKVETDYRFNERDFNLRALPVLVDGQIVGGLLLAMDVTQRVKAEQIRKESEARYRLVAENIPDSAVHLFDHDLRFLLATGPALNAYPSLEHPIEGKTLWDVMPEEEATSLAPIYQSALEGKSLTIEMVANDRYYSLHTKPVLLGDKIIGGLLLSHDITERKQTEVSLREAKETAEEATRAKSTFLANMSHEIRTPLNAIVGATGLLLNTELTEKQKEYANIVRVSSDSLLALVSDILDFSKIEAEKLDLEERPFDLRSCIEETLDLLQPQSAAKQIDLIYIMDSSVPEWVIGDKNRVRQILMNLLSNAVKFTPQGDIQIIVEYKGDEEGKQQLHIAVQDTGIGLGPDQNALIFEAFTQGDTSTTRRYGGTGLGLAICKRLVQLMGGEIWFDSTPNVGSTFYVTLQLPPASPYPLPFPGDEDATLVGKRILIVVSNPTLRQLIANQSRTWGMRPLVSALEQTALAFLRQPNPPFEMVLWDESISNQPDNPLYQLMRDRAEQHQIPVILLGTGYPAVPETLISHTAYLHKPFKPGRFYEILVNLVEGVALTSTPQRSNYLLDTTLGQRYPLDILLAEDNLVNQRVTLAILERLGYQATLVDDGREALEVVRRTPFDVILMDVQMPVLSGVEATQLIRRIGDRIPQPFIIALTANAMQGDREQYLAAGMDAYLSKPLDITALQSTLQKAAEQKQNRAARSVMDKRPLKVHPVLDRAVLFQLSQVVGDTQFEPVATVIELFLEEAPHYVNGLQRAVATPDLTRSIELAHTLKSSSAALGGMAFSARCAMIEAHARAGRLMDASLAVNHLTDEYQILAAALLAWRRDVLRNP